jgi:hypothetical protein
MTRAIKGCEIKPELKFGRFENTLSEEMGA